MAKLAIIAVAIFMLAGAHIAFNSKSNLNKAENRLAKDQHEILARNAAAAGLERAEQKLADNFYNYPQILGSHDDVTYTTSAHIIGTEATVTSTGISYMTNGDSITFNIKARFKRRSLIPPQAPAFMRYAVITDRDLILRGNVGGDIYVDGDADNELNANMHSNQMLKVQGNAAFVNGFGTFVTLAEPSASDLSDKFIPNHNPSGADHVYQTNSMYIPPMNPSIMAGAASPDSTTLGDVTLSGSYDLGTREDPYVWYVQGDLIVSGNTTLNGYNLFYVNGSADLSGNVYVGNSGYDAGDESSAAFYVHGGLSLKGGAEVWGQIYTSGDVLFDVGTPSVYGSITAKGSVDFRGTADIFYREASPALTRQLQPDLFVLDRIAYSEW